jgi:hypothetical protein
VRVISNKLGNYVVNRRHIFKYDDVELVYMCVYLYLISGGARARGPRPGEPIGL